MQMSENILTVKNLHKQFDISGGLLEQISLRGLKVKRRRKVVHAVNGVEFEIARGEALCLVGESGCGKTTLGRLIIGLLKPTQGTVQYHNTRIDNLPRRELLTYRKKMQMIFQNPYASLNPRQRLYSTLVEPLKFHFPYMSRGDLHSKVISVMESVGVDPSWGKRFPHELSGGQRQRISIARALTVDPEFIVADEPISALDVSIQAQILNLLMQAGRDRQLTYLFITHDLSVVKHFATRVAVMYLGAICEIGKVGEIFATPRHPYTQALLSAIPKLPTTNNIPNNKSNELNKLTNIKLPGEVPTPINLSSGCGFHSRCRYAREICKQVTPQLITVAADVQVACHAVAENWH